MVVMAAREIPAPVNPKAALDNDEIYNITVQMDWSINSENDWSSLGEYGNDVVNIVKDEEVEWITAFRSNYTTPAEYGYGKICYGITDDGYGYLNLTDNTIYLRLRYYSTFADTDETIYSDWTEVFTIGETVDDKINASDWAIAELEKAKELGLIPDSLDGADLTKAITRAEFAAVSVKAYEKLLGTQAIPAVNNPFTDTQDVEVLKAYNAGITSGVSADKFDPNELLNREQAATMLTRVFKKISLTGWTLSTDGNFTLPYEKPAAFADDSSISDWAKNSVYFMAANGIITGVGENNFAPKNITTEEEASGYANATREQALIIAVRMVENLK